MEMSDYVHWCNERRVHLWFNTIREPAALALHNLPADELRTIRDTLLDASLPTAPDHPDGAVERNNIAVFRRFVDRQVTTWLAEAEGRPRGRGDGVPVAIVQKPAAR